MSMEEDKNWTKPQESPCESNEAVLNSQLILSNAHLETTSLKAIYLDITCTSPCFIIRWDAKSLDADSVARIIGSLEGRTDSLIQKTLRCPNREETPRSAFWYLTR